MIDVLIILSHFLIVLTKLHQSSLTSKQGHPSYIFCCAAIPVRQEEEDAGGGEADDAPDDAQEGQRPLRW